jgi:hypothetical protein
MKDFVRSALQWLADTRLARCVADAFFRSRARRRVVELDHQSVARCQRRTLLGLVHKARTTRFGRDHDFRRIQTIGDFQRLVPLRTPAELWRDYWQPTFPSLAGATWPGPIPYLAISSGPQAGPYPYIPFSPDLWAAQQTAALTALAFVMHARPRARLCSGRLFFLGGGTLLTPLADPSQTDSLEAIAFRKLPAALQPYALSSPRLDAGTGRPLDEHLLRELAERSTRMPVTCIAGTADRLTRFFAHLQRVTGRDRVADIWPSLAAVLYTRGLREIDRADLVRAVGSPEVLFQEMYFRPEGAIAFEDPRYSKLRLLPDHGVYFEFVPVEQLGKPRPARYGAAEVKLGVPYALALSSAAGVWACLVGSVLRFERRDPPLLRLVEMGTSWDQTVNAASSAPAAEPPHPFPPQPPHPRPTNSDVSYSGRSLRASRSARAD